MEGTKRKGHAWTSGECQSSSMGERRFVQDEVDRRSSAKGCPRDQSSVDGRTRSVEFGAKKGARGAG